MWLTESCSTYSHFLMGQVIPETNKSQNSCRMSDCSYLIYVNFIVRLSLLHFVIYTCKTRIAFVKQDVRGLVHPCWRQSRSFNYEVSGTRSVVTMCDKSDRHIGNTYHEWKFMTIGIPHTTIFDLIAKAS